MKVKKINRDLLHKALDAVLDGEGYTSLFVGNIKESQTVCITANENGVAGKEEDFDLHRWCTSNEEIEDAITIMRSMRENHENDHT